MYARCTALLACIAAASAFQAPTPMGLRAKTSLSPSVRPQRRCVLPSLRFQCCVQSRGARRPAAIGVAVHTRTALHVAFAVPLPSCNVGAAFHTAGAMRANRLSCAVAVTPCTGRGEGVHTAGVCCR
jgi:hypothetical protein